MFIFLAESKRMLNKESVCGNTATHQCCVMLFMHSILSCLPQHRELSRGSLDLFAGCPWAARCAANLSNSHRRFPVICEDWQINQTTFCKAMRCRGVCGFWSAEKVGAILCFRNHLRNRLVTVTKRQSGSHGSLHWRSENVGSSGCFC